MNIIPLIPRERMPQIDFQDLCDFEDWLDRKGVAYLLGTNLPFAFYPRQIIDAHVVQDIETHRLENKPILVSIDNAILDGNHRWMDHIFHKEPIRFLQLPLFFDPAVAFLFTYNRTYSLGDGHQHPNREAANA